MRGTSDFNPDECPICPECKNRMVLTCYGAYWLCQSCDHIERSAGNMNKLAKEAKKSFLAEHKKQE